MVQFNKPNVGKSNGTANVLGAIYLLYDESSLFHISLTQFLYSFITRSLLSGPTNLYFHLGQDICMIHLLSYVLFSHC